VNARRHPLKFNQMGRNSKEVLTFAAVLVGTLVHDSAFCFEVDGSDVLCRD
jgi:hypothetical protein